LEQEIAEGFKNDPCGSNFLGGLLFKSVREDFDLFQGLE